MIDSECIDRLLEELDVPDEVIACAKASPLREVFGAILARVELLERHFDESTYQDY